MADVYTEIQAMHVVTATEPATQPYIMLPSSGAQGRYQVRIQYQNALQASGSGTWTFSVLISTNGGVSWASNVSGAVVTLTSTAQYGEQLLQINPSQANDTGRFGVMVIATLGGAPTTPALAYRADLLTL